MAEVSVRDALQQVATHPELTTDELTQVPVHQLVCRALFEVANSPDASVRGSAARANKARKLILDRMVGKRAPGTKPATKGNEEIEFVDLTGGVLG